TMLAAQSAAAARIARLPRTARESPQSNASGLKSTTRPVTPIRTPMTRLGVSRSCRKILAAGATQSGVVYASTTVRPVDTSSRPTLARTTNPTMWSSVMLSTTGTSARVGRTSRRRALQELGQHQVIELEPGALRGLHAEIARLGVDVNAGAGQQGRRDHVGRGGAAHERRPAGVPVGGSLVGMPDAQDGGLAEGPA